MQTKVCKICLIKKDITEFHKHKLGKFGVVAVCKICVNNHVKRTNTTPDGFKICRVCKIIKDVSNFNRAIGNKQNVNSICKCCQREYNKTRWAIEYKENKQDVLKKQKNYRDSHKTELINASLKRKYNINLDQYNEMLKSQNGVCAICGKEETVIDKYTNKFIALSVDHNHQTGKIRELLCSVCNPMLGRINEDIQILQSAINYLKKHKV